MIPILTGEQVRKLDRMAIDDYKVPSLDLMESAGRGAYLFLESVYAPLKKNRILIACGKGNNAGDGFVIARYLKQEGCVVNVAMISTLEELSPDAKQMSALFREAGGELQEKTDVKTFETLLERSELVIDALLGTGISKTVLSPYKEWIELINNAQKPVFALDIPSGISADTGDIMGVAIKANWSATFAAMKLGLVVAPGCQHAGDISVIDIGIPQEVQKKAKSSRRLIDRSSVAASFHSRNQDTHKGTYGHVLVVAGSATKIGAALMTGKSALRSGAGLATIVLPEQAFARVPLQFLELMYETSPSTPEGTFSAKALKTIESLWEGKNVIATGPGMGVSSDVRHLIRGLVLKSPHPLVIDADGVNALKGQLDILPQAKAPIVITPHPGEMANLTEVSTKDVQKDRLSCALSVARQHKITVVLKGYRTVIAVPEGRVYINPTGNPGMATAGMGDVLTGIIAGFLAQGMEWTDAITSAVYLHGLAGDRLAERMGDRGLLAGDVIDSFPFVMKEFVA